MYIAEIRGKFSQKDEYKEDILTSNVFSFFKYANRQIFLFRLLSLLGFNFNHHELDEAKFYFWPTYEDGTEPDLVIVVGDYYILFEAKFHSGFSIDNATEQHQLLREIEVGKVDAQNKRKKFQLIVITAHYSEAQFLTDIAGYGINDFKWINWHQIALLISDILESEQGLSVELSEFANDLYTLLLKKNLRIYSGMRVLKIKQNLREVHDCLFFDSSTAQYRGDFIGFTEALHDLNKLGVVDDAIFICTKKVYFSNLPSDKLHRKLPESIFFRETNQ